MSVASCPTQPDAGLANAPDVAGVGSPITMGDLRKACAYRAKYRKTPEKQFFGIKSCGVHYDNRGGVYCTPSRVLVLCVELCRKGFYLPEADHEGCAVQEVPASRRADVAARYQQTFLEFNQEKVKGSVLEPCFGLTSACNLGLLAHNHLLLVLLSMLNGIRFEGLTEEDKSVLPLNSDGCLDLTLCRV